jgi:outer membrane protein assembly factor BamD
MRKNSLTISTRFLTAFLIIVFLAGCATLKDKDEMPAEDLAKKGLDLYNHGRYFLAVETFNTIKERFPFSRFSLLAELKSADCKFYMKEYPEAIDLYKKFEQDHPTNEAIPYVLFQIGRSHFRTLSSFDRETSGAHEAIKIFERLTRNHPKSSYVEEAKVMIRKSINFLADHELYVARFYFRTKEYDQARGRAEYLISAYPDSPAAAEAKGLISRIDLENEK